MADIETSVVIIGGGACGLMSSIILSDLGIDHLLVERRPTTSHLPKAHYLNQRTMEVFRQHGVADSVYAAGMPLAYCKTRYITSLGGDGPLDARVLYTFDSFGGGPRRAVSYNVSAGSATNIPQIRLEPILKRHADERAPGRIRFNQEAVDFSQDSDGVTARIRDRVTETEYSVRAEYMIASDGGKFVGPRLGVTLEGTGVLAALVTAHITADLSRYMPGDAMITHLIHPASNFRWGALVPLGPTWGKHSEEWAFNFAYRPDNPARLAESDIVPAIRSSLRLPDLPIALHRVNEWGAEASVADRFQVGRIFLGGDAAHRVIPTSGLGLNSATHDAHNLCWKLAAVLKGCAAGSLLDTYEAERRPANRRNADWSFFTFTNHLMVEVGLGLVPGATIEDNIREVTAYLSDTPLGRTRRARAKDVVGTQRTEYGSLEIELGATYDSDAVVPDGSPVPDVDPMGDVHAPVTRPGHRLPHAWIDRMGKRISTHDLTGASARFALITGTDGMPWCKAAIPVSAAFGVAIKAIRIGLGGEYEGDYVDLTGAWDEVKEIGDDGVVLVRPDNVVAYRSRGPVSDPVETLKEIIGAILRSDAAPPAKTL